MGCAGRGWGAAVRWRVRVRGLVAQSPRPFGGRAPRRRAPRPRPGAGVGPARRGQLRPVRAVQHRPAAHPLGAAGGGPRGPGPGGTRPRPGPAGPRSRGGVRACRASGHEPPDRAGHRPRRSSAAGPRPAAGRSASQASTSARGHAVVHRRDAEAEGRAARLDDPGDVVVEVGAGRRLRHVDARPSAAARRRADTDTGPPSPRCAPSGSPASASPGPAICRRPRSSRASSAESGTGGVGGTAGGWCGRVRHGCVPSIRHGSNG